MDRFRQIYQTHESHVRRTLHWLLPGDAARVDDLVQEVFVRVWRKLPAFREESSLKTWVYRIAVNTAWDSLRSKTWRRVEAAETETVTEADAQETRQIIQLALQSLDSKRREVFVLRYFEELSIEEISEVLGAPEGTVKRRLFEAREEFKKELARNGVTYE